MNQLAPRDSPDIARVSDLPRITPSSLSDLDCGRRYFTLRILKQWPRRPMVSAVAFGIAVHDSARLAYQNRVGDKPCLDHIGAWARTAVWRGRWPEGVDRNAETDRVIAAVCAFVANDASDPEAVEGILDLELSVEHPIPHQGKNIGLFSCKLDQTLVRVSEPNKLIVREIKTGAVAPRIDLRECYIQLSLAKRLYKGRGFDRFAIEFLFLDEDARVCQTTVEDRDLKGLHAVVMQAAVTRLTDTEHKPTSCEGCCYCPIRNSCPIQKAE